MAPPLFPVTVPRAIARMRERNAIIRAFVSERADDALREHSARMLESPRSVLHGVPFSLKDDWESLCLPTTGGSWRHRNRRSPKDSAVLRAFVDAGAILIGKTNLSDFGLAPEASSWVGGRTRNPENLAHTAGGSSGGAAAAVADGMSAFDWGTDIGGSIRMPAGFCGVFGMKLAAATWPLTDLFPFVPRALTPLCSQGPIARTLPQIRAILETVSPALRNGIDRGTFVPKKFVIYEPDRGGLWGNFAKDVSEAFTRMREYTVNTHHDLPSSRKIHWIYNSVWCSHFFDLFESDPTVSLFSGLRDVLAATFFRGLFGKSIHPTTAELLLQIALGRLLLFRDKKRALANAKIVKDAFERVWDQGAIVVMPVAAWGAPRIGRTNLNPRLLECTVPGNLADATGLSLPFGRWPNGLPRSIQLLGPPGSELSLIEVAEKLFPR
jgi:Asp-tRNA(Asn)/Glu-tRNA(Gln) amidotransferase A subunit family amidase